MKKIAILGSTGSIGVSALNLIDLYPEDYQVGALAAGSNGELLLDQCRRYRPGLVSLCDEEAAQTLARELRGEGIEVVAGPQGVVEVACCEDTDLVLSAIMGGAGLVPTIRAVEAGKDVALANKEALVMAGELVMSEVARRGVHLVPVDSEHSALHQCLRGALEEEVKRLVLTASGGPFREKSAEELARVTPSQALDHPTWEMGPKITVDSATLMNKGLEVIEAHHLFDMPGERIDVIVHPQSVVHSMVEFVDGTFLAQLSITDMRTSLLYAFSYPQRKASRLPDLDLSDLSSLEFFQPDWKKFPCLKLAYEALEEGGTYPVVLNAANEVAVERFLREEISFPAIPALIGRCLESHTGSSCLDLERILEIDEETRCRAREEVL